MADKKRDRGATTGNQINDISSPTIILFGILILLFFHQIKCEYINNNTTSMPTVKDPSSETSTKILYQDLKVMKYFENVASTENSFESLDKNLTSKNNYMPNVLTKSLNTTIIPEFTFSKFIFTNITSPTPASGLSIRALNGENEKSNFISGRQLVDITAGAVARKQAIGAVKNDHSQRNAQGFEKKIKIKKSNNFLKNDILFDLNSSLESTSKKIIDGQTKVGNFFKFVTTTDKTVSKSSPPWTIMPLALISDNCNEMKIDLTKKQKDVEDHDMEFMEKQTVLNRKSLSLQTDTLLKSSIGISHIHSYDKERRHISEEKANSAHREDFIDFKHKSMKTQIDDSNKELVRDLKTNETSYGNQSDSLYNIDSLNTTISQKNKTQRNKTSIFDFYKRKTMNNDENIEEKSDIIDDNYDFNLTPEDDIVDDIKEDMVITQVTRFNESKLPDKDEKWFAWHGKEREGDTVIRFSTGPPRDRYIVPTLNLSDGTFIFRFLSMFFTFLHPFDFPAELLRDVMWNTLSVSQLILQSIRVEVGFISAILIAIVFALAVPAYGTCRAILAALRGRYEGGNDGASSPPPPGLTYEGGEGGGACEKRVLLFFMQLLLLTSVCGITTMIIGNEFASNGVTLTRETLSAAARDLPTYLRSAHGQLSHVLLDSSDQAFAAVNHDLDCVDILLGEPIQRALATETGIDVALDALSDITRVSVELSMKASSLGTSGSTAEGLANSARDRLRELRRQLDVARRHCSQRDRPLCETIDSSGVELNIHFDMITEQRMEPLAETLKARNLSEATDIAKEQFAMVPQFVANQTNMIIEDIRLAITEKRADLRLAERSLSKTARHLTAAASSASRHIEDVVRAIDAVEFWRWLIFLVAVLIVCLVVLLLTFAVFCGCCGAETQASSILQSSVVLMCLFSIPLWGLAIVVFVAGGHGEVFLCRPLYDYPDYKAIGKLFDRPGLLYNDGSGFFHEVFRDLGNISIDVPMREVLRECEVDRPAYPVFGIRRILDLDFQTAHFSWSRFAEASRDLEAHSPTPAAAKAAPLVHRALLEVVRRTSVNLTDYRMQLNGPLTGKDLNSLANQLESIANQISDLTTSSRIETLAARTRRLATSTILPLDQLRTELIFKLTELELHMQPFQRQMNQSLSHLKTIQYYIDNQGSVIAEKKTREYVSRLTGYLEQYRGHVLDEIERHVAPCGPIWDIYNAGRTLVCRHYIDSLNGFWLGLCGCLFIWIGAAPLALKLRRACRAMRSNRSGLLLRTISHQNTSENAVISEQSAWSTPGEQRRSDNWR